MEEEEQKSGGLRELSLVFHVVAVDCHSVCAYLLRVHICHSNNAGLCAVRAPFCPALLFLQLIQQVNHNITAVPIFCLQNVIFSFDKTHLAQILSPSCVHWRKDSVLCQKCCWLIYCSSFLPDAFVPLPFSNSVHSRHWWQRCRTTDNSNISSLSLSYTYAMRAQIKVYMCTYCLVC